MHINRPHNLNKKLALRLNQKSAEKLSLKLIVLNLFVIMFLSACGIKGNLYQTTKQPVKTTVVAVEENAENTGKSQDVMINPSQSMPSQPTIEE